MTEKNTPVFQDSLDAELADLLLDSSDDMDDQPPAVQAEAPVPAALPASPPKNTLTNFPSIPKNGLSGSPDEALDLFKHACRELALHGDYAAVRDRICQLQIELNNYGLLAPSFRPRPKAARAKGAGSKKEFTASDMAIHRDLLVIDCHWLFVRRINVRVATGDVIYQPLFNRAEPFDFSLAWTFANENWRNDTRVDTALRLPTLIQYQLAALRSNDIANDLQRLTVGIRKGGRLLQSPQARVSVALQDWAAEVYCVEDYFAVYEAMYQAYWLLGPEVKVSALTELTGLIQGSKPLNPRTFRGKLDKLLARLGGEWSKTGPNSDKFH